MDMKRLILFVLLLWALGAHAAVEGLFDTTTGDPVDPATQAELDAHAGVADAHRLTRSAQSPTTADITGAVNTHYMVDLSGLTADRSLTLPTASAGDELCVTVTTGDADYELIIKGAATVTINGGSAATEWSRVFVAAETVCLQADSATAWFVVAHTLSDLFFHAHNAGTGDTQSVSAGTASVNSTVLSVIAADIGSMLSASGTRSATLRRAGRWQFGGTFIFSAFSNNSKTTRNVINVDSDTHYDTRGITNGSGTGFGVHVMIPALDVGAVVSLGTYHNDTVSRANRDAAYTVSFWGRWVGP